MDELSDLLIRTLIIYFVLTLSMRIMGKRQIGQMELSELVTTLLLSEVAAVPIVDFQIPLRRALIPMMLIISLEIIVPFIGNKSRFIKKIIEGKPSFIIYRGKVVFSEIRKNRVSFDDIVSQLRTEGYFDISKIEYLILEPSGSLSVFPKQQSDGSQLPDRMVHSLIIDGEILEGNLKLLGVEKRELLNKLHALGNNLSDITLLGVDDRMNIVTLISKNSASEIGSIDSSRSFTLPTKKSNKKKTKKRNP